MMTTMLDLLIIVVGLLAAAGLVSMALMFLVKNEKVRRGCLWIVAALGVYVGTVGLRIMWPMFTAQAVVAVLMALVSIGAILLERLSRTAPKWFLGARIAASVALVVGMLNAFL